MKIVDITDLYLNSQETEDVSVYINNFPEFFEFYKKYYAGELNFVKNLDKHVIEKTKKRIIKALKSAELEFKNNGFTLDGIEILLFVGNKTADGHAFLYKGKMYVWFAIEAFVEVEQSGIDYIVIHEITHAIHYNKRPDLYPKNFEHFKTYSRLLNIEGVATYFSKKILNLSDISALWPYYLSEEEANEWMLECDKEKTNLKKVISNNFNSFDPKKNLFFAVDRNDIYNFRSGYYIGLIAIKYLVDSKKLDLESALDIRSKDLLEFLI